ncbi:MAG TPA: alpha-ketoglutarate-dependent dioxygenase AlkB [Allosphingosinicella sp.]|nr:alpha-ketoglutarate-dependent dioxygenase AlkB [Allosphingosinicella sp.]
MPEPQLSLFENAPAAAPAGLAYAPDFIGAQEEGALAERIAALSLKPFEFHGFTGHRRTISFGLHYAFDGSGLREADPLPDWLQPLRARAAALAGLAAEAFAHALVIEYAPGAGIGWHRDRPVFGDVVGISLLAAAPLRFRRRVGSKWERFTLTAEPRSAYLLRGEARNGWEHSIPQLETLRYSVTFRTLKEAG